MKIHSFQFFCSFDGEELIEAVRQGRKREFEAFHSAGMDVPDPQSEIDVRGLSSDLALG